MGVEQGAEAPVEIDVTRLSDDELVEVISAQALRSVQAFHGGEPGAYSSAFRLAKRAFEELERRVGRDRVP